MAHPPEKWGVHEWLAYSTPFGVGLAVGSRHKSGRAWVEYPREMVLLSGMSTVAWSGIGLAAFGITVSEAMTVWMIYGRWAAAAISWPAVGVALVIVGGSLAAGAVAAKTTEMLSKRSPGIPKSVLMGGGSWGSVV